MTETTAQLYIRLHQNSVLMQFIIYAWYGPLGKIMQSESQH